MDCGGLWKIIETVSIIFKIVEYYFKQATPNHVIKIDCKNIVSKLLCNSIILHYFTILKNKSNETIKKEIAFNLMEDLLTQISI